MKSVLLLSILLCAMTLPSIGALLPEDLDKIRLIVKEEVAPIKTETAAIKQDIAMLNGRVDGLSGRVDGLSERIDGIEKIIPWLMVLIVVAVGIPQVIVAWGSRKDREQDRKIEELTREIEALKQHIVNP